MRTKLMGATDQEVLEWISARVLRSGQDQKIFAKSIKSSPPTIHRIVRNDGKYEPAFKVVYNLMAEILGKYPFKISENELLPNIFPHGTDEIVFKLAHEVQGMDADDVSLIFQFLAVLKNRSVLGSIQLGALIGSLALLHEKVMGSLRENQLMELPTERGKDQPEDKMPN